MESGGRLKKFFFTNINRHFCKNDLLMNGSSVNNVVSTYVKKAEPDLSDLANDL